MYKQIHNWVEQNRSRILDINRTLVGIPSENLYPEGNEKQVQLKVKALLEEIGFETDMFALWDVPGLVEHPAYLDDGRNYKDRPNVVGTLKGQGGGRSILFSGHMDTVPRGQDKWTQDPFGGEVVGNKQYGLGIFDMKSGMAAVMMAVQCLRELEVPIAGDVMIETVVDEEFGGANGTLASRLKGYEADIAVIPEPSNMVICPINQGGIYYRITFRGTPGRSYSGEMLSNPAFAAGRFLEIIRKYHVWRNERKDNHPMFTGQSLPTLVQKMSAGDQAILLSDRVPETCFMDVWIQCYPGVTEEHITKEFHDFCEPFIREDEILSAMPPVIEKKIRFLPGTGIDDDHPFVGVAADASKQVLPGGAPVQGAPFACDSFMFNLHSTTPAVILGPKGGNAHSGDEFIYVDEFMQLVELYALVITKWCGAGETQ